MPYDQSLDEKVFSKAWEKDGLRLTVSVFSYNKGVKKVQISRETQDSEGEYRFGKLGRMTKEELEGVLPFLTEAAGHIEPPPAALHPFGHLLFCEGDRRRAAGR